MARYAMIEASNTGYVWGIENAEDALAAVRQMDDRIGRHTPVEYEMLGIHSRVERSGRDCYAVHEVPDRFDVEDGRDREAIERVQAHPLVAYVTCTETAD